MERINHHSISSQCLLIWASVLAISVGGLSAAYYGILKWGHQVVWVTLPHALHPNGTDDVRSYAWIITTLSGCLVGIVVHYLGAPSGIDAAIDELHRRGRIDYQYTLGMFLSSLLSPIGGSSAGPESPLVDINGGLGSWLGDRLKWSKETTRTLSFCGISAALGAFFGSPLGSALLALELPHRMGLEYYEALIPVMVSAVLGFATFRLATGLTIGGLYTFPAYSDLHPDHLIYAVLIGIIGAGVAVLFIKIFREAEILTRYLPQHPIWRNTLGGLGIGLVGMSLPLTLFYGEQQIQTIINTGSELGIGSLLLTALGKVITVSVSLRTGFRGGFIFPLLFIGADVGMAISLLIPQIPPTVGMICMMAAVTVAVMKTPISIVLILSVISHTELTPVITIAVIISFLLTTQISLISTQQSRIL